MRDTSFRRWTGILFILGALLVNVPYMLLIAHFEYPDILRQPPGAILTRFQAGGPGLVLTWLAFAWVGFPLFVALLMLRRVLEGERAPLVEVATTFGVISLIAQITGLLRWVFVVPALAAQYTDPAASTATRAAAEVAFLAVHQYGGVLLGEHIGQFFAVAWTFLISLALMKSPRFKAWLGWAGLASALVYLSAQSELLATSIPGFPVVPEAGLIGSLMWLAWIAALGISLVLAAGTEPGRDQGDGVQG